MYISEYKTIEADSAIEFDQQVNAAIKEGFQPFGNPYSVFTGVGIKLYQAMVKSADQKH
jgi:hypothetical protein